MDALLAMLAAERAKEKAAWAALKKQMQRELISWSKDGKTGYDYYKTCKFVGVTPLPENKEGWVDTRVPHPGKHMRKVFEDIKAHEAKFEAAHAEYRKRCAALEVREKNVLGDELYVLVKDTLERSAADREAIGLSGPRFTAGKITGMILEAYSTPELCEIMVDDTKFSPLVKEAFDVLAAVPA